MCAPPGQERWRAAERKREVACYDSEVGPSRRVSIKVRKTGGKTAHLTDRFYDIDVAADLSQLANELQRLPKKAPRTAYGAEEPLKDPLLMLSFEYSPVYFWLAYYCSATRRTKLSPGPQEVGLSTISMQRYFAE
jgi:hypothetical protein